MDERTEVVAHLCVKLIHKKNEIVKCTAFRLGRTILKSVEHISDLVTGFWVIDQMSRRVNENNASLYISLVCG